MLAPENDTTPAPEVAHADAAEAILSQVDLGEAPFVSSGAYENGQEIHAPTAREALVAKMRRMADQVERGELDGVRIQWRDGLHFIETVERDQHPVEVDGKMVRRVRLLRYEIMSPERPLEPPAPYDRA